MPRSVSMKLFLIFFIIGTLFSVSVCSEYEVCGNRPRVKNVHGSRVIGGKDAEPGNWPWIVSIQEVIADEYFHICEGVILNNLWVLTAAHCFKNHTSKYQSWRLVFGTTQLSHLATKTQIRTIQHKVQHEKYNHETELNDIALLRLNKPIAYDDNTQPACLPAKQAVMSKLTDCYIAGWGALDEASTGPSDVLQEAVVNLIPAEHCSRPNWYNGVVGDYNLCAGYGDRGIDSCQADSGGPLMCKRSKAKFYSLVGISSWGSSCGEKQWPGVYTSTQYYLEWIYGHMSKDKTPQYTAVEEEAETNTMWPKSAEKISNAPFSVFEGSEHGVCGNRPLVKNVHGPRVVEGKDAEPGNWPWVVSIQEVIADEYLHLCGGVILNHLWVLTAAHCFKNRGDNYYSWRVVLGTNQPSNLDDNTQIRSIVKKVQHPEYNPETEHNDIVLLRLNRPIGYDSYTQPACLPANETVLSKMTDCYTAGWGVVDEASTGPSDVLREVPVNLIPIERCSRPNGHKGAEGDYNLCAGYENGGTQSCQGDIGGILMCKRSKPMFYTVVGIPSLGSGCGQKQSPGIYTSTQYYLKWIYGQMSEDNKPTSTTLKKAVTNTIWPKSAEKISKADMETG